MKIVMIITSSLILILIETNRDNEVDREIEGINGSNHEVTTSSPREIINLIEIKDQIREEIDTRTNIEVKSLDLLF